MRGISEMYQLSGGTNWEHTCEACKHFYIEKKHLYCSKHPEEEKEWKRTYIACKFFEQ